MGKFYLNIYYRSIAANRDEAGSTSEDKSPGHVYVGLKGNEDKEEFFGLYQPDGLIPVGMGKVKTDDEKEMHARVGHMSQKDNQDYVFIKQIELKEDQYSKAIDYARSKVAGENYYVIGLHDCIDFAQSIYNAAGLPLYFTHVYSSKELSKLPNLASYKMSAKYGSRDEACGVFNIEGISEQEIASKLNIPVECIRHEDNFGFDDSRVRILPTFQVRVNESHLLSKDLVKTIVPEVESEFVASRGNPLPSASGVMVEETNRDDKNDSALIQKFLQLKLEEKHKRAENLQKLARLEEKVKELLEELDLKANDIIKGFIRTKKETLVNKNKRCIADTEREIQQIIDSIEPHNQGIYAQKQAELEAETSVRVSQAKAQAAITPSMFPTTVVISNADIKERKQSEYESLMDDYKKSCEAKIEYLKCRVQQQCEEHGKGTNDEISQKVDMVNNEMERFSKELGSYVLETESKLMRGEDVDIDAVINEIRGKMSGSLSGLKNIVSCM